jgi:hypothetical protein
MPFVDTDELLFASVVVGEDARLYHSSEPSKSAFVHGSLSVKGTFC